MLFFCQRQESETVCIMKKILPIFLLIVCLLGGCGSSSSNYSGEIRPAPDASSLSFYCSYIKDNGAVGGCFGTSYYCVMSGGKTVIYEVSSDTTANNGYTVKYVIKDMPFFDDIASDVKDEDWKALFRQCQKLCKFTGDGEVVSEGMNDLDSRYEDGRYKWEDEYESLMFNTVVDSSNKNDSKRVVKYDNEYDNATVTLTHDGDKYYIEYVAVADDPEYADSFSSGPYGGEIDKSYYTRIMDILDYIDGNQEKFNEKAVKYSQLDMANPTDTLLMNFATSYLALSADEEYKDDFDKLRYEADSYLNDIEQIIVHEDASLEDYYIFEDIPSGGSDDEGGLHDYYAENDYNLQIVDYDK